MAKRTIKTANSRSNSILRRAAVGLQRDGWYSNVVSSVAISLMLMIVSTFLPTQRAKIVGLGIGATILLWVVVLYFYKAADPLSGERELRGALVAGELATPFFDADKIIRLPSGVESGISAATISKAIKFFLGPALCISLQDAFTVLQADDEKLVWIRKTNRGLFVSAKVVSEDQRIVAKVIDNEFQINPNNYFRRERPSPSELIVFNQKDEEALRVEFLNATTIRLTGLFYFKGRGRPLLVRIGGILLPSGLEMGSNTTVRNRNHGAMFQIGTSSDGWFPDMQLEP